MAVFCGFLVGQDRTEGTHVTMGWKPLRSGHSESAMGRVIAPTAPTGSKDTQAKVAQRERQLERIRTDNMNQAWIQRVLKR